MNLQHIVVVNYMNNLLSGKNKCSTETELEFYTKYVEINELIENDYPLLKKTIAENSGIAHFFEIQNEINSFIKKFHRLYCKMNKIFKQWKDENVTIAPGIHTLQMNQISMVKTVTDIMDVNKFYSSLKQSQCHPLQS